MKRWVTAVTLAAFIGSAAHAHADRYLWPSYNDRPGPGGFATVTLESPIHAGRVKGPDFAIRLRTDNLKAAVLVKLDGRHIDRNCKPFVSLTENPHDYPQWEFMYEQRHVIRIPVCGVAPGLHVLEIERGSFGSSLATSNDQRITFIVE